MNISANTLFHFVPQRKFLESILNGKLIPRYCVEHFEMGDILKGDVAIPMKCFCDIPLSQIYEHTNMYGKFAIGFTKEWAQRMKITPILYLHTGSPHLKDIFSNRDNNTDFMEFCKMNPNIKYVKPYKGKMLRNKKWKEVCFYNEREWRFVSKSVEIIDRDKFEKEKEQFQSTLKSHNIDFKPSDIEYIIVQEEKNRIKIIDTINKSSFFSNKKEKELGISKIFSVEHIREDV